MRDDIHKSAPVARPWQKLLRNCTRDAEKRFRAAQAREALISDARREITPAFINSVLIRSKQTTFLSEDPSSSNETQSRHVLEHQVSQHMCRRMAGNEFGESALRGAISDALSERLNSQALALKGHVMNDGGKGVREACSAIDEVCQALEPKIDEIAEMVINNDFCQKPTAPKKDEISLDEDLR